MNITDVVELKMDRMTFGPAAVGRIPAPAPDDGRNLVIFVEKALPGEKVRAKLTKKHKNYWEANLLEVLEASPDRITPPCEVFDRCGGCQWQHLDYPAQLRAKEEVLLYQLHRAAKLEVSQLKERLTVHAAQSPYGYRARLQAHGNRGGIGFYAEGSHSIVQTEKCVVAHPDIQKAWTQFLNHRPLEELAKTTGQFQVEWTRTESGQIKETMNRKPGALGFTQINPEQNAVLVDVVTNLVHHSDRGKLKLLLDLYGGDGNLSHKVVDAFDQVVSVDTFNSGVDAAQLDTLKNGRTFIRESVEDFLNKQRLRNWRSEKVDAVIVDPPRSGLKGLTRQILDLKSPKIILVSCDPSTLARDLAELSEQYTVESVHLIDMFPQTYHIETVVELNQK